MGKIGTFSDLDEKKIGTSEKISFKLPAVCFLNSWLLYNTQSSKRRYTNDVNYTQLGSVCVYLPEILNVFLTFN